MTLSARNIVFKLGVIFSFICLLMCIAASVKTIPVYTIMETEITHYSATMFQIFAGTLRETKLLAVHCCILVLVLFSFSSLLLINYFFEKTQSPEILFVVFFAGSFSVEALRLILPLGRVYQFPSLYLLMASRVMLFGRYFGIFSLFTASVYAAGFKAQNQRNVILVMTIITLILVMGIPIDTQTWNSSLNMINGHGLMFRFIETVTILVTTIGFLITAWSRRTREFILIGIGAALAFFGRNILLNADSWVWLPPGVLLLIAGTWCICTRLHKVYLWL